MIFCLQFVHSSYTLLEGHAFGKFCKDNSLPAPRLKATFHIRRRSVQDHLPQSLADLEDQISEALRCTCAFVNLLTSLSFSHETSAFRTFKSSFSKRPKPQGPVKGQNMRKYEKIWENMRKWIKLIKEAMTGSRIWTWIDLDGIGAFAAFAFRCFRWDRSFRNFLCLKCSKLCNIHRTRMPNSVRLHSPSRINPAKVISPPQLQLNSSVARCLCQYKAQHNFSRKWQQEQISKIMACWWFPSLEKFEAPPEVWFPSLSRLTVTNISCKHYYTESTWWELGTTIFFGVSVHQVFLVSLPLIQVALSI